MKRPGGSSAHLTDRRAFLTNAAIASAAIAVAPRVLSATTTQDSMEWKPAACHLCGVGCGLLVAIQRGRAVAARPDPDHPVNRGMACVKGYYAIQSLYARDRITRALVRQDGALVPTSMPRALDDVATRIKDAVSRHGPDSVALYGSAHWSAGSALMGARLFRGAIGSRHVDTSARLHSAAAEHGLLTTFGATASPGCYEDLDQADVFILWDVNLAETDPVLFSRILERRRVNSAVRVIDVSTRTTRTSYASDRALLCAPQSALFLANAVCHEIVASRSANRAFVNRHVAFKKPAADRQPAPPVDVLHAEQTVDTDWNGFVSFLGNYTPERARRITGVAEADIRWLASLYGDPARRVVSLWGEGVNRQHDAVRVNNALHNIHLLVGKVASPGNGAFPVSVQPGGAALVPDVLGHRPPDESGQAQRAAHWGTEAARSDTRQATTALSIFRALERGEIRVLWIQATNPMLSLPNARRFRAAARRGAFIVVSDAYPTATTDVADVVLPSAMWIERAAVTVNAERRIQWTDRLVAPPGDSMSDSQQLMEVARRLGHGSLFPWDAEGSERAAWEAIARTEADRHLPDATALRAAGALWPSSGARETRWRYNAEHDAAADRTRGFDFHDHPDHRAWIWLREWEAAPGTPDREFPNWLAIGDVVEHWGTGTLTRRIPTLHRAVPRSYVEIHRLDAQALGVRDGDIVRLTSRVGAVDLEARVDHRGQPPRGTLFAPAFDEQAAVNALMPDDACPVSGQIREHGCAVRVTRVGSAS